MAEWWQKFITPETLADFAAGIIVGFAGAVSAIKRRWLLVPDHKKERRNIKMVEDNARLEAENKAYLKIIAELREELSEYD